MTLLHKFEEYRVATCTLIHLPTLATNIVVYPKVPIDCIILLSVTPDKKHKLIGLRP